MIAGVVHMTSKVIHGFTSRKVPKFPFRAFDTSIPTLYVGCSKDRSHNLLVLVDPSQPCIVQILGRCGDRQAEEEALLWRYSPTRWKKTPPIVVPSFDRRILDVPTINIDPEGCRDIDDCISVWNDGVTHIAITIADVHAWVDKNPWMLGAASIGQTFYKDGRVKIPMLPSELSDNLMSLIPGEKRLGLALIFEWNGQILNPRFEQIVLINKRSCTYDKVEGIDVDILRGCASFLAGAPLDDPHDWVEQYMLFYNRTAAETLKNGVFRGHAPADATKLEQYRNMGADVEKLAYSAGIYSTEPIPHWGLNMEKYCHASSPIRRWADVVNQGSLKGCYVPFDLETLNKMSKHAKKYERDLFFLERLFCAQHALDGIVLDSTDRTRVWVPEWKRIITVRNWFGDAGTRVKLTYFIDMGAPTWKKRLVFRCEGTGCPEQQRPAQSSVECLA